MGERARNCSDSAAENARAAWQRARRISGRAPIHTPDAGESAPLRTSHKTGICLRPKPVLIEYESTCVCGPMENTAGDGSPIGRRKAAECDQHEDAGHPQ
jgi:hypothetical protein